MRSFKVHINNVIIITVEDEVKSAPCGIICDIFFWNLVFFYIFIVVSLRFFFFINH
jgi:hypothetical protein